MDQVGEPTVKLMVPGMLAAAESVTQIEVVDIGVGTAGVAGIVVVDILRAAVKAVFQCNLVDLHSE
jgi:hypothetical protein